MVTGSKTDVSSWCRSKALPLAAVAIGILAGCASVPPARTTVSPRPPEAAAIVRQPGLAYAVAGDARQAQAVYLRKSDAGWDLLFDEANVGDPRVEKIWFWPREGKIAFAFGVGSAGRVNESVICAARDMDRAKRGYAPCTSNFLRKHATAGTTAGRAVAAVLSAGLTEVDAAVKGKSENVLDHGALLEVVSSLDLEKRWRRREYQQAYTKARGRAALASFAQAYRADDPDGLARQADDRIRKLDENAATLARVDARLPPLASYQTRYLPPDPARYCRSFNGDAEALRFCQGSVLQAVKDLSLPKAQQARRFDLCRSVSKELGTGPNAGLCETYQKTSACTGKTDAETRTCNTLKGEG